MSAKASLLRKPAKTILLAGAMLSALGLATAVWASGDSGYCAPDWRLAAPSYDCAGRAMLSPGNDTRINMLLLMRSLRPASEGNARDTYDTALGRTFFSWDSLSASLQRRPERKVEFELGNCQIGAEGILAFRDALAAEKGLSAADRSGLDRLRGQVGCRAVEWGGFTAGSAPGREYLAYLKAADAFYGGDWAGARAGFSALTGARSRWVAETARYMPIRIGLRAAVAEAVDQYGDFAGPDKANGEAVTSAREAIADYLKAYPKGRYAASAKGLIRRVAWLENDQAAFARLLENELATRPGDTAAAAALANEIDGKLLEQDGADAFIANLGNTPLLLTISNLKRMRSSPNEAMPLPADELALQKNQFSAYGDLYGFLLATRAFQAQEQPATILRLLPDAARESRYTPLAFSRQVLRGMTLNRASDPNEAGFWRELLGGSASAFQRPLVELGLATRWQRGAKLADIFAPGSPVTDTTTRELLLQTRATPAILRAAAKDPSRPARERDIALFSLLFKQLNHGAYGDFTKDLALVPADADHRTGLWSFADQATIPVGLFSKGTWGDEFVCPSLDRTAAALARNPRDRKAQLCLGDFYRLNGFDGFRLFRPGPTADYLGYGPDGVPGRAISREDLYNEVIADRSAGADLRAYALYRAVMCYAPSGYSDCLGAARNDPEKDAAAAPQSRRKGWFTELKQRYPDSQWAKDLRYYW
ncbi:MAG: hypothetical protein J7530_06490 [Novosphingobium sp.]|nr:hypothetical protein [Novosphingobium sp.]